MDLDMRIIEKLERVYWSESDAVDAADERGDAIRAVLDELDKAEASGDSADHDEIRFVIARALGVLNV